jgi:hypothetical protein
MPAVAKIRFVAATLLEDLDETQPSDKISRAQQYLCTSFGGDLFTNAISSILLFPLTYRSAVQFVRRVRITGRSHT